MAALGFSTIIRGRKRFDVYKKKNIYSELSPVTDKKNNAENKIMQTESKFVSFNEFKNQSNHQVFSGNFVGFKSAAAA